MANPAVTVYNHFCFKSVDPEDFPLHEHDVYELLLFVKFKGSYFAEGSAYNLGTNDIILIPPSVQHRFFIEKGSDYERYDVLIDQSRVEPELRRLLPSGQDVISAGASDLIISLFSELDRLDATLDEKESLLAIDSVVKTVLYHLCLFGKEGEERRSSQLNPLVANATDYINKNLFTLKGVEEICNELYVTKSHLHHVFRRYLMTTPKKYINTKRLHEAQRMIRTGISPSDVYSLCGFSDYTAFYRNYKALFGYPPSREGEIRNRESNLFN